MMSWADAALVAPLLWLVGGALVVLLADAFIRPKGHGLLATLSVLAFLGCGWAARQDLSEPASQAFGGAIISDGFGAFFALIFALVGLLTVAIGAVYMERDPDAAPEFYPLLLFSAAGMVVMVQANDLVTLFLGLETMSIALYALAAIQRHSTHSHEAGFKYLILGAFSSAFLLYGMSLLYGTTGSTNIQVISQVGGSGMIYWTGWALLLVGLAFKVALVPFHMWTPDVYEGSPAPVAGFMAAAVKAASFAAFLRLFWAGLPDLLVSMEGLLIGLAVVTMCFGNLVALAQTNIKRMLAYSAIAHAGYLLVGIIASKPVAGDGAAQGVLFYLFAYALMNVGAFALVTLVSDGKGEKAELAGLAGLARRNPLASAAVVVFMLSLAGVPPTAGFWGKFYIFEAAMREGYTTLAVIAFLNSAVALFYYLRVIVYLYMRDPSEEAYEGKSSQVGAAMLVAAAALLFLGVYPGPAAELARIGVEALAAAF